MSERQLVRIIREICSENEIEFKSFSYNWILQLSANSRRMYIYGYKFPNNNAAIEQICNDKSALSDILYEHKISHVEHYYFASPNNAQYVDQAGDWPRMIELLHRYRRIVCKSNSGSGGRNVFKVDSQKALEGAVHKIFSKVKSMSIAPYRIITAEYRVIIVNSRVELVYEKKKPSVMGNGVNTVKQLIEQNSDLYSTEIEPDLELSYIPALDEVVEVTWKHNLSQGAKPIIITDIALKERLSELALSCALALNIEFASVDIVQDEYGFEVLEVNSGIMMENLALSSSENYIIAKEIYKKAILNYLKMDDTKHKYFIQHPRKKRFVLPILEEIAREKGVEVIPDKEEGNFSIFVFKDGKRFVAKDYPFNINNAGSISLCANKTACSSILKDMGYRVPREKYFIKKADIDITLSELKRHFVNPVDLLGFNFPMMIKPNSLSQGIGIYKIDNPDEGILAAKRVMSLKDRILLVQEYCEGHDYRIVVLNNKVIQAYERIPFQLIGNGYDTIEKLLDAKVASFVASGRDKSIDISDSRIINNIIKQGFDLQTVLKRGVVCQLQNIANLSLGGTTRDVIEHISTHYVQLAISIAKALGLRLCGIDIMAKDISNPENTDYYILEVNSAPGLDNYVYEGQQQVNYVKRLYGLVFDYLEKHC